MQILKSIKVFITINFLLLMGCASTSSQSNFAGTSLSGFLHADLVNCFQTNATVTNIRNNCRDKYKRWFEAVVFEREQSARGLFEQLSPDIKLPDICPPDRLTCPTSDGNLGPQPNSPFFELKGFPISEQIQIATDIRNDISNFNTQSMTLIDTEIALARQKKIQ